MPQPVTYRIIKSTGFYPQLNTLLLALQGVAVAVELRTNGRVTYQPGDFVTLEARHLANEVRLPLVGPIEAAMANVKPDEIHLTLVDRKTFSDQGNWLSGFVDFANQIFLPFLVNYHEQFRSEIEAKHNQGRTSWPSAWQMSWALRNAASHGGRAFEKATQKPVAWRGLTFSPTDEPSKSLLSMVNGADILQLMLEMEEARSGVPLLRA